MSGNDIIYKVRLIGSWFEDMSCVRFPFDTQALAFSFAFNCRTTGMTPVELRIARDFQVNAADSGFRVRHQWQLLHDKSQHTSTMSYRDPPATDRADASTPSIDFNHGILLDVEMKTVPNIGNTSETSLNITPSSL